MFTIKSHVTICKGDMITFQYDGKARTVEVLDVQNGPKGIFIRGQQWHLDKTRQYGCFTVSKMFNVQQVFAEN